MSRSTLQAVLRQKIPMSVAMGIRVRSSDAKKGVRFTVPLRPNHNHKKTAFGGSLVAAQALASWALLMEILQAANLKAEVVLQREQSEFLRPVSDDFAVATDPISSLDLEQFLRTLKRHARARLTISARALADTKVACRFTGQYVAILTSARGAADV